MAVSIARILSQLRIPVPVALGGTGSTTADSARSALGVTGRNRIINGSCDVTQRGSNGVFTTGISGYGGPDRFFGNNSSSGGRFDQSASTLVSDGITKNCVTQTVVTAVPDITTNKIWSGITQLIEGVNCYDLLGKPITVSFLFKASVAGMYSVSIRDGSGTYSYVSSFTVAANVVTPVTVTTSSIPLGAAIPNTTAVGMSVYIGALNSGTYNTSTLNAWQSGNFVTASGFTNWGTTVGATISITELQLEVGSAATQFERLSIADHILKCQRYYELIDCICIGYGSSSTNIGGVFNYKVLKRTTPTLGLAADGTRISNVNVGTLVAIATNESVLVYRAITATGNAQFHERYALNAEL